MTSSLAAFMKKESLEEALQLVFLSLNLLVWVMGTVGSEGLSRCLVSLQLFGFGEQPTLLFACR